MPRGRSPGRFHTNADQPPSGFCMPASHCRAQRTAGNAFTLTLGLSDEVWGMGHNQHGALLERASVTGTAVRTPIMGVWR